MVRFNVFHYDYDYRRRVGINVEYLMDRTRARPVSRKTKKKKNLYKAFNDPILVSEREKKKKKHEYREIAPTI